MKVHTKVAAAVLAALSLGMSMSAPAQDKKGPNKVKGAGSAPTASATAVESLRTAHALARYGDANKDALALITAARIVKEVGGSEGQAKQTAGKAAEAKNKTDPYSADALLERAKAAAGGRTDLIALADDVAKSGTRRAVGGPGRQRAVLGTRAYHDYRVVFRGGEPARVAVSGDGDSDLDLFVYDELGNLVCRDDDASDDMYCAWNPRWTGPFRVRVVNRGIANEYFILTN